MENGKEQAQATGKADRRMEPARDTSPVARTERVRAICPLVLFGSSVAERAEQTRVSERTFYTKTSHFEEEGIESLFASTLQSGASYLCYSPNEP